MTNHDLGSNPLISVNPDILSGVSQDFGEVYSSSPVVLRGPETRLNLYR